MSSRRWVCPACTLTCDDVELAVEGRSRVLSPPCRRADAWLKQKHEALSAASTEELKKLVTAIGGARAPMITGIENLDVASQQTAVKVAERFSAYLDVSYSHSGSAGLAAFQRHGKVTATLGEVANRSDFVLLWYCDPLETHPRFVERILRKESGVQKKVVVVDDSPNSTTSAADESVMYAGDPEVLVRQLRMLAQGKEVAQGEANGLFSQLVDASYAAVFLPAGLGHELVDAWHQLARELNGHTRMVLSSLTNDRNGAGASQVLASLTGFPESIRFVDRRPVYNGGEFASANVLARRECDFLLVCDAGADQPFEKRLDRDTLDFLASIPVAVLTDFSGEHYQSVDFLVPVATPGLSCGGDFHRMDDVSVPLVSLESSPAPSPAAVLEVLLG